MRKARQAAAYSEWLIAEIQEAIDDPRPSIPHEDVMARMDARIATLKAGKAAEENAHEPTAATAREYPVGAGRCHLGRHEAVFALIARVSKYGYEADFKAMMDAWSLDLAN